MGRRTVANLWHSRARLLLYSVIIGCSSFALFLLNSVLVIKHYNKEPFEKNFLDDVDYAYEALNYMYDLQHGKAKIRPVVEQVHLILIFYF